MNTDDLDFTLYIDCEADFADLRYWFREEWVDLGITWDKFKNSGTTPENWISLETNEFHNPLELERTGDWLVFPYKLVVIFKKRYGADDDVLKQVAFMRLIRSRLTAKGCIVQSNTD